MSLEELIELLNDPSFESQRFESNEVFNIYHFKSFAQKPNVFFSYRVYENHPMKNGTRVAIIAPMNLRHPYFIAVAIGTLVEFEGVRSPYRKIMIEKINPEIIGIEETLYIHPVKNAKKEIEIGKPFETFRHNVVNYNEEIEEIKETIK